jgi:hypothetical protein
VKTGGRKDLPPINRPFLRSFLMIKAILTFIIFNLMFLPGDCQQKIECGKLPRMNVQPKIFVDSHEQKIKISKKELITGLWIILPDTSIKILGFVASYDCHSGRNMLFDINSKTYHSNHIRPNDLFISGIWKGDLLVIDCINPLPYYSESF